MKRLVAVVLLMGLAGCSKKETPPAEMPPPEVMVTTVVQRDTPVYLEVIGQTRGSNEVQIQARVQGFLETQNYKDGTIVNKGQLLYTIDPKPFQAALAEAKGQLAQAQAQLAKAKLDVERFTPLVKADAISKQELDNAVMAERAGAAAVEAAQAAVQAAEINLGYTKVYSPVDGLTGMTAVQVGNLVGPGATALLTTVSAIQPIRVRFSIPERDYLQYFKKNLERGQAASGQKGIQMTLADGTVYPHAGALRATDGLVDPTTGTLMMEAEFPNPGNAVRTGQYARVRVEIDFRKGALLVPQRAVQQIQGVYLVAVVNAQNKVEMRRVEAADRTGSLWVIDKGLNANERVIVEGLQKVHDGMVVAPKAAGEAAQGNGQGQATPQGKR